MLLNNLLRSVLLFTFASIACAAYSAGGHNVAVYWGQGSGQESLGTYCAEGNMDIVLISFVNNFQGNTVSFNFGNACSGESCSAIAKDIKTCQSKGVKVLLSMGGAVGSYGISSDADAAEVATKMYDLFGPKGTVFPGAEIDGVDLDIEAGAHTGYTSFVSAIKKKFSSGFLVSAAPQCVYPDAYVGDALKEAQIDMAFIQFYNNYCSLDKQFNWDTWTNALSGFANKNMKLYIGLPGSSAAAGSGYVTPDTVKSKSASALGDSSFGGFMVWDAVTGTKNTVNGKSFIANLKSIVGSSSSSSASASSDAGTDSDSAAVESSAPTSYVRGHQHIKATANEVTSIVTASPVTVYSTVHANANGAIGSITTEKQVADGSTINPTVLEPTAASATNYNTGKYTDPLWAVTSSSAATAGTSAITDPLWNVASLNTDVLWAVTSLAAATSV